MTKDLGAPGAAKPAWDWKDDDCLRAFIEVLREETGAEAVGKRLAKSYAGSFTRSAIGSGLRRAAVLKRLPELAEDAGAVLAAFHTRGRAAKGAQNAPQKRPARATAPRYRPAPPPVAAPAAETPPRREMTTEERADTDAINAYFARLRP